MCLLTLKKICLCVDLNQADSEQFLSSAIALNKENTPISLNYIQEERWGGIESLGIFMRSKI